MLVRRILLTAPVLLLFVLTSLVFLAARAPRTWASHWSNPSNVGTGAGQEEYGSARSARGWDILWFDDDHQRLMFSPAGGHATVVESGDDVHPTLLSLGNQEFAVWVHNSNGRTRLEAAVIAGRRVQKIVTLVSTSRPLEHPYLFRAGNDAVDLIFSWQRRGNFEQFLMRFRPGSTHGTSPVRLNSAPYYSFYPRAAADSGGSFGLMYLNSCCKQDVWELVYQSYDPVGHAIGRRTVLYRVVSYGQGQAIPGQWGMDIRTDAHGHLWGAFTGDGGVWAFEATTRGRVLLQPRMLDMQPGAPASLAIIPTTSGGTLLWEQANELGSYIESQQFASDLRPVGAAERAEYGSGSQTNLHATLANGRVSIMWQTVSRGVGSTFQTTGYESNVQPTIAQRLGLGLGDPWEEMAVLIVAAFGVATLTTTGNILFALGIVGLLAMRIMRHYAGKWIVYACLLTGALYYSFVAPGGPIFFLDTIPSMGLAAMPFGFLASVGALGFVSWVGATGLKRIDEVYRVGIMAFLGVYFFAFVEATVFIQQRLGYI